MNISQHLKLNNWQSPGFIIYSHLDEISDSLIESISLAPYILHSYQLLSSMSFLFTNSTSIKILAASVKLPPPVPLPLAFR